ncbi:IS91 family transposase [Phreatobacter sp.]|uniref:IS91 family transposase n=1 Tax=Phreatobacter sp. TaxID=1966341 RepID=UPI0025E11791|nr:IS91 family transposase [Phreatobacter sp.]
MRGDLEVADVFRRHGPAYRHDRAKPLGRVETRVMSAITLCRTAALGGHVEACGDCTHSRIAYNSCRNRHCPKCQGAARETWLAAREKDLLPTHYFHVVFTVPAEIAAMAFQNKAVVYAILFEAAAFALRAASRDQRHLGGETGAVAILHTWGQALTHHPHVHCLVPGGALASDGRWIACKPNFLLPVHVLSRLFRRRFVERLEEARIAGSLSFFGELAVMNDAEAFAASITRQRHANWVVYAKPPFGSPRHVLAYLGRYTHRVAIANSRLVAMDDATVSFRWRDYRHGGAARVMTLDANEFIRRFLLHALPDGFHRIRHFGFLANGCRRAKLAVIRGAIAAARENGADSLHAGEQDAADGGPKPKRGALEPTACPCCGGTMRVILVMPRRKPWPDTS